MLSIDRYKFAKELPKSSTPNLRFICLLFSADPFIFVLFNLQSVLFFLRMLIISRHYTYGVHISKAKRNSHSNPIQQSIAIQNIVSNPRQSQFSKEVFRFTKYPLLQAC